MRRRLEERQGARLETGEVPRMSNSRMADGVVSSSSVDERGPARSVFSKSRTNTAFTATAGPRPGAKASKEDEDVARRRMEVNHAAMQKVWNEFFESTDFSREAFVFIDREMSKDFEECSVERLRRMITTARMRERASVDARQPEQAVPVLSFNSGALEAGSEAEAACFGKVREWDEECRKKDAMLVEQVRDELFLYGRSRLKEAMEAYNPEAAAVTLAPIYASGWGKLAKLDEKDDLWTMARSLVGRDEPERLREVVASATSSLATDSARRRQEAEEKEKQRQRRHRLEAEEEARAREKANSAPRPRVVEVKAATAPADKVTEAAKKAGPESTGEATASAESTAAAATTAGGGGGLRPSTPLSIAPPARTQAEEGAAAAAAAGTAATEMAETAAERETKTTRAATTTAATKAAATEEAAAATSGAATTATAAATKGARVGRGREVVAWVRAAERGSAAEAERSAREAAGQRSTAEVAVWAATGQWRAARKAAEWRCNGGWEGEEGGVEGWGRGGGGGGRARTPPRARPHTHSRERVCECACAALPASFLSRRCSLLRRLLAAAHLGNGGAGGTAEAEKGGTEGAEGGAGAGAGGREGGAERGGDRRTGTGSGKVGARGREEHGEGGKVATGGG